MNRIETVSLADLLSNNFYRGVQLVIVGLAVQWWLACEVASSVIAACGLCSCFIASFAARKVLAVWLYTVVLMHLLFGMHMGLYDTSTYYDLGAHALGMGGLVLILLSQLLNGRATRALLQQTPMRAGVAVTFALALGAGWELFEFFIDYLFDLNAQRGLLDTNLDLLADLLGGLIAFFVFSSQERLAKFLSAGFRTMMLTPLADPIEPASHLSGKIFRVK